MRRLGGAAVAIGALWACGHSVAPSQEHARVAAPAEPTAPTVLECDEAEDECGKAFARDCAGLPEPACMQPCKYPHGLTADGGIRDECWQCILVRSRECIVAERAGHDACERLPRCGRR